MIFNPIQMGADFTSWYMSDIECTVRDIVDQLHFYYGRHNEVPIDVLEKELQDKNLNYADLPFSCKEMIDELEIC